MRQRNLRACDIELIILAGLYLRVDHQFVFPYERDSDVVESSWSGMFWICILLAVAGGDFRVTMVASGCELDFFQQDLLLVASRIARRILGS